MKREIQRRIWAWLGAAALLVGGPLAAAPAQAQSCTEEEEVIWELVDALGYALVVFDDVFDTNPTEQDCEIICKKLEAGCRQAGTRFAQDVNGLVRTGASAAGILCKTAADPRTCRAAVIAVRQQSRTLVRDIKALFKERCADPALATTCSNACNLNQHPQCCEEAFGGTCS